MLYINQLLISILCLMNTYTIDFDNKEVKNWNIVNDGVMGGLSKGRVEAIPEGFHFYGNVSLENNGGFTSFQSPNRDYALKGYEWVEIRYKSKGIENALQLSVADRFYIPNYKVHLPLSDDWVVRSFPLNEVRQYRVGDPTGEFLDQEALSEVIRLSFITDEKKAGDFHLLVDYVKFK